MRVAIVGGTAAGLLTALLLARSGHEVTVLERDRRPIEPDVESAAAAAFRASAPQVVHPHVVPARCREVLAEHLPDVSPRGGLPASSRRRWRRRCRRACPTGPRGLVTSGSR